MSNIRLLRCISQADLAWMDSTSDLHIGHLKVSFEPFQAVTVSSTQGPQNACPQDVSTANSSERKHIGHYHKLLSYSDKSNGSGTYVGCTMCHRSGMTQGWSIMHATMFPTLNSTFTFILSTLKPEQSLVVSRLYSLSPLIRLSSAFCSVYRRTEMTDRLWPRSLHPKRAGKGHGYLYLSR